MNGSTLLSPSAATRKIPSRDRIGDPPVRLTPRRRKSLSPHAPAAHRPIRMPNGTVGAPSDARGGDGRETIIQLHLPPAYPERHRSPRFLFLRHAGRPHWAALSSPVRTVSGAVVGVAGARVEHPRAG